MEKVINSDLKIKRGRVGFKRTASFLNGLTQKSFEKRGFAQSKLIINWNEIVGPALSQLLKPSCISFGGRELGATLTLEINGAYGPELELQKELIKEKVNRIYGYKAVSKIKFKSSSVLGYEDSEIDKSLLKKVDGDYDTNRTLTDHTDTFEMKLKFDTVSSTNLRRSLAKLCSNFSQRTQKNDFIKE